MSVPRERSLYIGAAISSVLFGLVAIGAKKHSFLGAADTPMWRFWSSHGVHELHVAAHYITSVGVVSILLPIAVFVGVLIYVKAKSIAYAAAPFFSVQITSLAVSSVKKAIDSARPPISSHIYPVHNAAFPSGHAANTTALVVATVVMACIVYPRRNVQHDFIVSGIVIVLLMSLTRLVLNVHWLSDVLGGAALGSAIALVVSAIAMRIHELLKSV